MNLLLDTHIWVRWLSADQPLPERVILLIEEAEELKVSAVSCWEVAYLVKKNRLKLPVSLSDWMKSALEGSGVGVVDLSSSIALLAADLPDIHRDPADRFIIASSLSCGFHLISFDQYFSQYECIKDLLIG